MPIGSKLIKAVIFDMDGVLVDSQPLHFDADILVLKECGINAGLSVVQQYAGMSNADRWEKYRNDFAIDMPTEEIILLHKQLITELVKTRDLYASDGVKDVLLLLKEKNISCSVASSSSYEFVNQMLEKIDVIQYFDIILSGEDMKKSKPAPDIFIEAAKKHGVDASECIVIEDSTNGVGAAFAAKIYCIGYINPTSGKQDLSKADMLIEHFNKLSESTDWLYV